MRDLTPEQYLKWKSDNVRYLVKREMEYKDSTGRTLGDVDLFMYPLKPELDLMIFEFKRHDKQSARTKAKEQLQRFRDYMRHFYDHPVRSFYGYYTSEFSERIDFNKCEEWLIVSNENDVMFS